MSDLSPPSIVDHLPLGPTGAGRLVSALSATLSNRTFWLGAAIGAGAVVLLRAKTRAEHAPKLVKTAD